MFTPKVVTGDRVIDSPSPLSRSLPANPMWIMALYVPGMKAVNAYWVPPEWYVFFFYTNAGEHSSSGD